MFRSSLIVGLLAGVAVVAAACGASTPAQTWTAAPASADPSVAPAVALATVAPATVAPASAAVPVSLSDFKVDVPATLPAGSVTFDITNSGSMPHEMLIFKSDLALDKYPTGANGDIVEDGAGITLVSDGANIDPKGTQNRTVDLSTPGTYLFVCNLPGHFKLGMYKLVTVAP